MGICDGPHLPPSLHLLLGAAMMGSQAHSSQLANFHGDRGGRKSASSTNPRRSYRSWMMGATADGGSCKQVKAAADSDSSTFNDVISEDQEQPSPGLGA